MENPIAKVVKVESKPKSKWRPLPMDTVVKEVDVFFNVHFGIFNKYILGVRKAGIKEVAFNSKGNHENC